MYVPYDNVGSDDGGQNFPARWGKFPAIMLTRSVVKNLLPNFGTCDGEINFVGSKIETLFGLLEVWVRTGMELSWHKFIYLRCLF